jgi:hypothetical protein
MKLDDIPKLYKGIAAVVAGTIFMLTYHNQFVTVAEAMEQQTKNDKQITYLIVLNMETKKEALIEQKVKAIEVNNPALTEKLEQQIQTLRDKIEGLCDNLDSC